MMNKPDVFIFGGAQMIQLGEASLVLAGGIESMSQAPDVVRGLRTGLATACIGGGQGIAAVVEACN